MFLFQLTLNNKQTNGDWVLWQRAQHSAGSGLISPPGLICRGTGALSVLTWYRVQMMTFDGLKNVYVFETFCCKHGIVKESLVTFHASSSAGHDVAQGMMGSVVYVISIALWC